MRRTALIAVALLLTACAPTRPVPPPKIVEVVVEKIVPVPAALTRREPVYQIKANTVEESVKAANIRKSGWEQCNAQLERIEKLTP